MSNYLYCFDIALYSFILYRSLFSLYCVTLWLVFLSQWNNIQCLQLLHAPHNFRLPFITQTHFLGYQDFCSKLFLRKYMYNRLTPLLVAVFRFISCFLFRYLVPSTRYFHETWIPFNNYANQNSNPRYINSVKMMKYQVLAITRHGSI